MVAGRQEIVAAAGAQREQMHLGGDGVEGAEAVVLLHGGHDGTLLGRLDAAHVVGGHLPRLRVEEATPLDDTLGVERHARGRPALAGLQDLPHVPLPAGLDHLHVLRGFLEGPRLRVAVRRSQHADRRRSSPHERLRTRLLAVPQLGHLSLRGRHGGLGPDRDAEQQQEGPCDEPSSCCHRTTCEEASRSLLCGTEAELFSSRGVDLASDPICFATLRRGKRGPQWPQWPQCARESFAFCRSGKSSKPWRWRSIEQLSRRWRIPNIRSIPTVALVFLKRHVLKRSCCHRIRRKRRLAWRDRMSGSAVHALETLFSIQLHEHLWGEALRAVRRGNCLHQMRVDSCLSTLNTCSADLGSPALSLCHPLSQTTFSMRVAECFTDSDSDINASSSSTGPRSFGRSAPSERVTILALSSSSRSFFYYFTDLETSAGCVLPSACLQLHGPDVSERGKEWQASYAFLPGSILLSLSRLRPSTLRWEKDIVVTTPLLDGAHHVLDLRIGVGADHGEGLHHVRLGGLPGHQQLEDANARPPLALPVLGIGVHPLQHVEGLGRVQEVAHAVAIVGDEMQKVEGVAAVLGLQVQLPGVARVAVHDVAPRQPGDEHEALLVALVVDQQQRLLGRFVVPPRGQRDAVVPVEVVVVVHVRLDAVEVDVHVVELLEQEEARRHALPTGNGVAFRRRRAHQLEVLLRILEVLDRAARLPDRRVHDALQDVLLRRRGLHVLDELPGLGDAITVAATVGRL
eukprot:scaffold1638_cov258-Pinguiococcus_pyrenoidosus.AAC.32